MPPCRPHVVTSLDHPLLQHGPQGLTYSIAKYSTVTLRMRFPPDPT